MHDWGPCSSARHCCESSTSHTPAYSITSHAREHPTGSEDVAGHAPVLPARDKFTFSNMRCNDHAHSCTLETARFRKRGSHPPGFAVLREPAGAAGPAQQPGQSGIPAVLHDALLLNRWLGCHCVKTSPTPERRGRVHGRVNIGRRRAGRQQQRRGAALLAKALHGVAAAHTTHVAPGAAHASLPLKQCLHRMTRQPSWKKRQGQS